VSEILPFKPHLIAVVGAGPAGLYAARELAEKGHRVFLFNRDIKPGGLAEYGIYPFKLKMKEGMRAQFRMVLDQPGVSYYGNVLVGEHGDLSLADLREMGFEAILCSVGAQGTKWLGLPGEDLEGVYHAKDVVYYYNSLPPFSQHKFSIGHRAAVIGMGNVMMDITHWLLEERAVEDVIAIGRRGPAEVKFDRKELEAIVAYLDLPSLNHELDRIAPQMLELGQDPAMLRTLVDATLARAGLPRTTGKFHLEFLASPTRILGDEHRRVCGLEVEETMLVRHGENETTAIGTGICHLLDVDTIIFAIGDRVDGDLGLPVKGTEFFKAEAPRFPMEGISYEVFDPRRNAIIPDLFVAGWARKTSHGLVGVARRDGINAARAMQQYLETLPESAVGREQVTERLSRLHKPFVTRSDLTRLEEAERERAAELGLEFFKFDNNEEMLRAMRLVEV
jgi:ferredoxin/flavodoxin---NADP+ reductase